MNESNILLYETDEGKINVDVILKDETIWRTQKSMAELFDKDVKTINRHLINIYQEEELEKKSTISFFEIVQKEGTRNVKRNIEFYNLDAIIAIGYRVNSKKATKFRMWATRILKEYMIKGFVIDVDKMKNGPKFGKDYYNELLQTIKEIRLSERRQYQKITDAFEATSIDNNKNSEEAYTFFKIVQNQVTLRHNWANCVHLTQHKEIEDLLYFKGIINQYHIKINAIDNIDNCDDLKIVLSILK